MSQPDILEGFTMLRSQSSRPFVTVTKKLVTFSRLAIKDLNNAPFVHVFFNPERKSFAVQTCEEDIDAIPFARMGASGRQPVARWGDKAVIGPIQQLLDPRFLEAGGVRIIGKSFHDSNIIIFDATNPVTK